MSKEKILVTSALPYANGPIHFGHVAGAYLPADVFVRYHKMIGNDIVYISGTDEHGVAITINAEKQGLKPQQIVDKYHQEIKKTFDSFNINFDNFSRTTLKEHAEISRQFFLSLYNKGLIKKHLDKQFYCKKDDMYLPDRYVEGTCPECGHEYARGDECPACGSWLNSIELIEPRCALCGEQPEISKTEHWYLQLQDLQPKLEAWLGAKEDWKVNVKTFVDAMLKTGLKARPVTRDLKWGIPVPLEEAKGKVLYVWFDAPIGYISSTIEWAKKIGEPEKWREYWQDDNTRLIHFIGKDNIPFHTIVFPAMLMGQDEKYILPENVPANEFYNYEGRKFSTSNGWYIDIDDFFLKFGADPIRYAIMAGAPESKDADFKWKEFQSRNNSELADSLGNFINRTIIFANKYFEGKVPEFKNPTKQDEDTLALCEKYQKTVGNNIDSYHFRKAIEEFIALSREGNRYFDSKAPWKSRKEDMQDCANTIYVSMQIVLSLGVMAKVFIPDSATKILNMIGVDEKSIDWAFGYEHELVSGSELGKAEVLFRKIEDSEIDVEMDKLKKLSAAADAKKEKHEPKYIEYEDFAKLDLRVGKVTKAEKKEGSDKLLRLEVDLGSETRKIIGSLATNYSPEEMIGKSVIVVFNLKPKKIMGEESQGMLLATNQSKKIFLLVPDGEVKPGAKIS